MFCTRSLLLASVLPLVPAVALAVCCPVFPPQQFLTSQGQTNLVIVNDGEITLIPNIVIAGDAADFALIVPTPSVPIFSEVDSDVWSEAAQLTALRQRNRFNSGSGLSCSSEDRLVLAPEVDAGSGIDVVSRETVGAFDVTVLLADDAESLLDYLDANGYGYTGAQADIFQEFIDEGWVFTAMKLDPDAPEADVPPGGWDHAVDPVAFQYEADEFVVALPVTSINRNPWMPMRFYVVADHRMDLPGFAVSYANRLSAKEAQAIEDTYPDLAEYLEAGRFFVRLDRTFGNRDAMDDPITLRRAETDDEVLPLGQDGFWWGAIPWWLLPLGGVLLHRRRRRRGVDEPVRNAASDASPNG